MGDRLWKERVARQSVSLGHFAGIDIWFACVTGRIDEETGFGPAQELEQQIVARIIQFLAGERGEGLFALAQSLRKSLSDITAGAEEDDHGCKRIASETTLSR